jgi:glycosyltransferase involved in cell wall biosynthesis
MVVHMKIGYFSTHMGTQGGPAIFDERVLHHIAKYDLRNEYRVYAILDQTTKGLNLQNPNFHIRPIRPAGKWLGVSLGLPLELKRRPIDLLHATYVPPPFVPARFVMTMTCWSQYSEPEVYPRLVLMRLVYLLNRGARRASAMFCYTEFLKEKVMEKFGFPSERVFITPPGIGEEMQPIGDKEALEAFLRKERILSPYILFIGALTKRKNVPRLIEAYYRLVQEAQIEHQLVLVGETLFLSDEIFETIRRLQLEDRVVLTGRKTHAELPWLYSGADVYVLPTLSEGFGMTPLEAMACGAPVVASNITSVPEVCGDGAVLVDPTDTDAIADAILRCLIDQDFRKALIQRGRANARRYSWDETARTMVEAYETIHAAGW